MHGKHNIGDSVILILLVEKIYVKAVKIHDEFKKEIQHKVRNYHRKPLNNKLLLRYLNRYNNYNIETELKWRDENFYKKKKTIIGR